MQQVYARAAFSDFLWMCFDVPHFKPGSTCIPFGPDGLVRLLVSLSTISSSTTSMTWIQVTGRSDLGALAQAGRQRASNVTALKPQGRNRCTGAQGKLLKRHKSAGLQVFE